MPFHLLQSGPLCAPITGAGVRVPPFSMLRSSPVITPPIAERQVRRRRIGKILIWNDFHSAARPRLQPLTWFGGTQQVLLRPVRQPFTKISNLAFAKDEPAANVHWLQLRGTKRIEHKYKGSFSERGVRIEFTRMPRGATWISAETARAGSSWCCPATGRLWASPQPG